MLPLRHFVGVLGHQRCKFLPKVTFRIFADRQAFSMTAKRNIDAPTKRRVKSNNLRHVPKAQVENQEIRCCTTVSTCERYDLAKVIDSFREYGLRSTNVLLPGEMVHVKYPYGLGRQIVDIIVLENGSLVAWGMDESAVRHDIVPVLAPAEVRSYKTAETEDMDYVEEIPENDQQDLNAGDSNEMYVYMCDAHAASETASLRCLRYVVNADRRSSASLQDAAIQSSQRVSKSGMIGDVIYIRGETNELRLLDKAAFSSGLARNTKLAALEISLENYISSIKVIGDTLASGGKFTLRGKDVLRITGKLLQIRGQLNLYSELIETPDLYWSEPELESLYTLISRKMDIAPRISILNTKLDYASDIVSILKSQISEEQSTRLEWAIIILIMIEVIIEFIHFAEKYGYLDIHPADRSRPEDTADA